MEQSIIDQFKSKEPNRDFIVLTIEDLDNTNLEVLFASPSKAEMAQFVDNTVDVKPGKARQGFEALTLQCVRYPDAGQFRELLDKKPLTILSIVHELQKLAGSDTKVSVKKV